MANKLRQKLLVPSIVLTAFSFSTVAQAITDQQAAAYMRMFDISGEYHGNPGYEGSHFVMPTEKKGPVSPIYSVDGYQTWNASRYTTVNSFLELGSQFGKLLTDGLLSNVLKSSDAVKKAFGREGNSTQKTDFRQLRGRTFESIPSFAGLVQRMSITASQLDSLDFSNSNLNHEALLKLINESEKKGVNFTARSILGSSLAFNGAVDFERLKKGIQNDLSVQIGEAVNAYVNGELSVGQRLNTTQKKHRLVLQTAMALYYVGQFRNLGTQTSAPEVTMEEFITRLKSEIDEFKTDPSTFDSSTKRSKLASCKKP